MSTALTKYTASDLVSQLKDLKQQILEQKNSEEFKQYLELMSRFHNYSFHNCMLIAFQCPTATRVAGYRAWQRMNRYVKKDEKAIRILVPCTYKKKLPETTIDDVANESHIYFKVGYVFDVSQTDGDALPEWDITTREQPIDHLLNNLITAIKSDGISIDFTDNLHAYGTSSGGIIRIRSSENNATQFSTLIHEYAHELLHNGSTLSREEKEVEAETSAYLVCRHFNIETPSDKYLASWMQRDDLFNHIERIRKATAKIINGMAPNQGQNHDIAAHEQSA